LTIPPVSMSLNRRTLISWDLKRTQTDRHHVYFNIQDRWLTTQKKPTMTTNLNHMFRHAFFVFCLNRCYNKMSQTNRRAFCYTTLLF
jgi:hypothetical protein